jgi:hypothetical protein
MFFGRAIQYVVTLSCLEPVIMTEAPQTNRFTLSVGSGDRMYDDV